MKFRARFVKWLTLTLFFSFVAPAAYAGASSPDIAIFLDGQKIDSDVSPYVVPKLNVTMVPLRVISENIGAAVGWNQRTKTVTIRKANAVIMLTNGQTYALVNGSRLPLAASVQDRNGRIMVPLRFVGEQLGLDVVWNQKAKTITLRSGGASPSVPGGGGGDKGLKGAWISTVFNLDWPSSGSYGNTERQKAEFAALLDELQEMGLNAVFVQVRPAGDALYPSALVPWSKFLTGTQGKAPDYDPLAFMIGEAHKRGMEFHAWFNPFRASTDANIGALAPNHAARLHPDWIVESGGKLYLNPGIPEVRQHIVDAIMEVVNGYEIDGVHLDDYFYPSSGDFPDEAAFKAYNPEGLELGDWRRSNINAFVKQLGESIHAAKPDVEFGISPFGVWRNRSVDPTGSDTKASVTAYDNMYADVRTWIRNEWIDYVAPQIYWSLSFANARYDKLVDWWAQEVRGTDVKLYIGHSPYKLGTNEAGWQSAQEIVRQLEYNKRYSEVKGDLFFSAKDLRSNPLGVADALREYYLGDE